MKKIYQVTFYHVQRTIMQLTGSNILELILVKCEESGNKLEICLLTLITYFLPAYMEQSV